MKDVKGIKDQGSGFTRKKVESLTLGEKIKKLRGQYRMSLTDISKATKIQVKYLEYLENGEYEKLPAEVYVRGFLKGYARHLGLDEEAFLKHYDTERNIQANLGKEAKIENRPRLPLTSSVVISSRSMIIALIALVVGGTFFYLFHQFRSFVSEPQLVIFEPMSGATIEGSSVILKGKTDRGAQVTVNGQGVLVGNDGAFAQNLVLQTGINTVTVTAVNRFEKEKVETLSFDAHFETPQPEQASQAQEKFSLSVVGIEKGATVSIEADDVVIFSGVLKNGDKQAVEAQKEVKITTSNAQNTLVSFKGENAAPLGEKAVPIQGVIFTNTGRK